MDISERTNEIRDIVNLMKEESHKIEKDDIIKIATIVYASPYSLLVNGFGGKSEAK